VHFFFLLRNYHVHCLFVNCLSVFVADYADWVCSVYFQSNCYTLEGVDGEFVDEAHEFERLKQSMEMVGFSTETQRR
jgi:myosin heavy subunit